MSYSEEEEKYLKNLGDHLRSLRQKKGWSQEKLANKSGLHRTYIGSIERGERNISLLNIRKIASTLDVSPSELLNFS